MNTNSSTALVRTGPAWQPARVCVLILVAMLANATARAAFFTLAPGGASGFASDAVYGPMYGPPIPVAGPPLPPPGFGPTVVLPPSPPPLMPGPPGMYFVDALSAGNEAGSAYMFSVAAGAAGLPGSRVAAEAMMGTAPSQTIPPGVPMGGMPMEQAGDIFYGRRNFVTGAPLPAFGIAAMAGPVPTAPVYGDEYSLGLNVGDDLAGLAMRMPVGGPAMFKYSIGMPGAVPPPYSPADILSAALPFGVPWAPAFALGLMPADNIDALITQDLAPGLMYAPGIDLVAFSLAPASPTLALIGAGPGDLLMAIPGGPPLIMIPAAALGLGPMDNLDAIDVVLPQAGDYNGDGRVDKRDYVVWRNALGMPAIPALATIDGNGDGMINAADYVVWRANLDMPAGPGPGAGAGLLGVAIPEPHALSLLSAAVVGIGLASPRRGRPARRWPLLPGQPWS